MFTPRQGVPAPSGNGSEPPPVHGVMFVVSPRSMAAMTAVVRVR